MSEEIEEAGSPPDTSPQRTVNLETGYFSQIVFFLVIACL